MGYSWDDAVVGQIAGSDGFHESYFLRAYVLKPKDHKYLAALPSNDYLTLRQRGQLEGMTESLYRLNNFRSASNTSYGRTGTYDIASKLGLYNPATSFNLPYLPERKRNPYENPYGKEKDQYFV